MGEQQHPDGAHGTIVLSESACTSCMLCVRECPTWCIDLTSHNEEVSEPGSRRPRSVAVLDSFTIDWGLCMFCGICVEVCPFDALWWTPDLEPTAAAAHDLIRSPAEEPAGKTSQTQERH